MSQIRFARGLPDEFISALSNGCLEQLLRSVVSRRLDVQIREHSLHVYAQGRRVLNLKRGQQRGTYVSEIHCDYQRGVPWRTPPTVDSKGYCRFHVDAAFLDMYTASIDRILQNAADMPMRKEATVEEKLIQENHYPGSSLVFFDRQVQLHGTPKRMDLIGLSSRPQPKIILTELKYGVNKDIPLLMDQISSYYNLIAPDGYLREDVSRSYRDVIVQKQKLGLMSHEISMPDERPIVECLVVLYDYNERSELLDRLKQAAKQHPLPVWHVLLSKGQFVIPPAADWSMLS